MRRSVDAMPDPADVAAARELARELLGGSRWRHTAAVAARAGSALEAVEPRHRPALVAAAWLHDIGYAERLVDSGFHPLDGARHLLREGWPPLVAGLVAHHSGARYVADVRGLGAPLAEFSDPASVAGPLADALTYADQTVGPDGEPLDVRTRLDDMLRRHGPDSPNARCHHVRGPEIVAAVGRTEAALRRLRGPDAASPAGRATAGAAACAEPGGVGPRHPPPDR